MNLSVGDMYKCRISHDILRVTSIKKKTRIHYDYSEEAREVTSREPYVGFLLVKSGCRSTRESVGKEFFTNLSTARSLLLDPV